MIRKKWIKKTRSRNAGDIKGLVAGIDFETEKKRKATVFGIRKYYNSGVEEITQLKGGDLTKQNIEKLLKDVDLITTYNGKAFDFKVLEDMGINTKNLPPHIDTMIALHRCGVYGGLKKSQKTSDVSRITGYNDDKLSRFKPVFLFRKAKEGDEHAEAELLLRNEDDTALKPLFATAVALTEMQQSQEVIMELLTVNLSRGDRKILESFLNHMQWGRPLTEKQKMVLNKKLYKYRGQMA